MSTPRQTYIDPNAQRKTDMGAAGQAKAAIPSGQPNPPASSPATPLMTTAQNTVNVSAPGSAPPPATTGAPTAAPGATPAGTIAAQAANIANAGQYNATLGNFDESRGAEGRVASITSQNSPLMQLAATRARQTANSRGLLNSSMAVGAAQNAVLDAATPIATVDANNYSQQQLANQDAMNRAGAANAGARASALTTGMNLGESARQFNDNLTQQDEHYDQDLEHDESKFVRGMAHDQVMARLDGDIRAGLMEMETDNKLLISSNENIANAWGTMMSDISKIQNNPDLDPATKTALINNTIGGFKSFTEFWKTATGGDVDVSSLLDFGVGGTGSDTGDFGKAPAGVTRADLLKYQQGATFDRADWQRWADATGYTGAYFGIDAIGGGS